MSDPYSPARRTALILTGTGADGAYHAGVLRALHEAGIKLDLVGGRGVGAPAAMLAAVDGAARLWDQTGVWRSAAITQLYRWRWPVRVLLVLAALLAGLLVSPLIFFAFGVIVYPIGLLLGMAGFEAASALVAFYSRTLAAAFAPGALPTWLPRLIAAVVLAGLLTVVVGNGVAWRRTPRRRRSKGSLAWALFGAPLDASRATRLFAAALWELLKGGANLKIPRHADLSRRFAELVAENLGQPGFRELLLLVHDIDARRDLVFGLVAEPYRRTLFPPPTAAGSRRGEAFDLAGLAREHVITVLEASLSVAGLTEAPLIAFAPDSYWRGEAHRIVDRPASLARLLEEAAAAGAEQIITVSAAPELPGPHALGRLPVDPLGWFGQQVAAAESAALSDALRQISHRFRAVYQIRPQHNPLGAFDLAGAYDDKSDRHHALTELMERGYEDAYRQFIEPVVAASGENLSTRRRV